MDMGTGDGVLIIFLIALAVIFVVGGLWLVLRRARPKPVQLQCRTVVDLILAYLEGTLPKEEGRAFEAHIADCGRCWRFLDTYRHTVELGQELREEAIPPEVHERLENFLRDRLSRP
jgi:hypothetical protein